MNECIPVEDLGTLARLPADDPRRRHAATCPRCSSLLFAYEEFIRGEPVEGSDPAAADARLDEAIEKIVQAAPGPAHVERVPRRRSGPGVGFARWRSVAVAAMVVVAAVALVRWQPWVTRDIVYRGEPRGEFSGLAADRAGGSVELRWDAVAGADAYRVTILAEDLSEVARIDPSGATHARFDPASVAGAARPFYWQVVALSGGGVILTSDPQRLP